MEKHNNQDGITASHRIALPGVVLDAQSIHEFGIPSMVMAVHGMPKLNERKISMEIIQRGFKQRSFFKCADTKTTFRFGIKSSIFRTASDFRQLQVDRQPDSGRALTQKTKSFPIRLDVDGKINRFRLCCAIIIVVSIFHSISLECIPKAVAFRTKTFELPKTTIHSFIT